VRVDRVHQRPVEIEDERAHHSTLEPARHPHEIAFARPPSH
jgi:hypothetical protein